MAALTRGTDQLGLTVPSTPLMPVHAPEGSAGGGPDELIVSHFHVWTDENGVSHQSRCELSAFALRITFAKFSVR
jgi:hypothetical protein